MVVSEMLLRLLALTAFVHSAAAQNSLSGEAAELFKLAQVGKFYPAAAALRPDYLPTSDGRSFLAVWRAAGANAPKHWIVSLHGSRGFATDDLALWSKHLAGRDVGLVCLQWWFGRDDQRGTYYLPEQAYREIDRALQSLGVKAGSVMFHGFSRGSANSYAIAALDSGRGKKYFALNVASSGGVALDFPPTRIIAAGGYGDGPLRGTRWVTSAGALDRNGDRDGIAAMRSTAAWLKEQGAIVEFTIEDPNSGHGALMLDPKNVQRVLDLFLDGKK